MKTALRTLLAVVTGMALAFVLVIIVELFSSVVHPLPPGFTDTMDEMCQHVARYPHWVLGVVVVAWSATAFVSTWVATRMGNRLAGIVVVLILTFAIVFNVTKLPYAMWPQVAMLRRFPVACTGSPVARVTGFPTGFWASVFPWIPRIPVRRRCTGRVSPGILAPERICARARPDRRSLASGRRFVRPDTGALTMSTITTVPRPPIAPSMAPLIAAEDRGVMRGVSWNFYDRLTDAISERSSVRIAFDGKDMEIMVVGPVHEGLGDRLSVFVSEVCDGLDLDSYGLGSTTWKRQEVDAEVEADLCRGLEARRRWRSAGRLRPVALMTAAPFPSRT